MIGNWCGIGSFLLRTKHEIILTNHIIMIASLYWIIEFSLCSVHSKLEFYYYKLEIMAMVHLYWLILDFSILTLNYSVLKIFFLLSFTIIYSLISKGIELILHFCPFTHTGCSSNIVFSFLCNFSELCKFYCGITGVWPAIVYTHWHREEPREARVRSIF